MASRAPETLSHCPLPFQWRGLEIRALTLQLRRVTRPRSPEELEALAASSPLPSLPPAPPLQRAEPSCNLSPEAKENVKGHQDSSCRAQTHYQLGLRMGKKKKENPLHDVLPANYELHPGLKQLTLSTIKILNPVWMRT